MTVDTGGLDDAGRARGCARARRALGAARHLLRRRARGVLRRDAALPRHGQRAARPRLSALRRRRAQPAGARGGRGGARARARAPSRTAAPRPATTRCASRWRCARSRPSSRSSPRSATRASRAPTRCACLPRAGLAVPAERAAYSVNPGLWGVTIGGKETTDTVEPLPEDAWVLTRGRLRPTPRAPERASCRLRARRARRARRRGARAGRSRRDG